MPNLMVIVASTRPTRVGMAVGRWFVDHATEHPAFDVDLADLAEVDLPFMDEPEHPRFARYVHDHTKRWSARVKAADAFVFVTPEYNHGYNAPLKNAIDFLHHEWEHKPVGFVSYGGVAAGTRAVQQLKPVCVVLRMTPMSDAVYIPFVQRHLDEERRFQSTPELETAATAMLQALERYEELLRPLRAGALR
ncbi:MAG: NAD(P)H-dependent oxidoreductase [Chloroflexi bacterium]|nr:MAG: NAD(P)H-dependent oxidoreductase [Chloroflexota bacterium]